MVKIDMDQKDYNDLYSAFLCLRSWKQELLKLDLVSGVLFAFLFTVHSLHSTFSQCGMYVYASLLPVSKQGHLTHFPEKKTKVLDSHN